MHGAVTLNSRKIQRNEHWWPDRLDLALFVERGVLKEVSMHHGSLRVELNSHVHHHMVCSHCKAITDIPEKDLGVLPALRRLPGGFQAERYAIDVIGICSTCQKAKRS